jgi:hypothetical protein
MTRAEVTLEATEQPINAVMTAGKACTNTLDTFA